MPITPFLRGQPFEPEAIKAMGIAFDRSCEALGLSKRRDRATEMVAKQIIELAERGVRDPDAMVGELMHLFKAPRSG
jgi:hypothetical protein